MGMIRTPTNEASSQRNSVLNFIQIVSLSKHSKWSRVQEVRQLATFYVEKEELRANSHPETPQQHRNKKQTKPEGMRLSWHSMTQGAGRAKKIKNEQNRGISYHRMAWLVLRAIQNQENLMTVTALHYQNRGITHWDARIFWSFPAKNQVTRNIGPHHRMTNL